mmetsp:Transcript_9365/g.13543  ORF Transcript_9365/g.13543 Transcript_9365/m.13543 type:complete len:233 (-) Transcript_9365:304-1002(-)
MHRTLKMTPVTTVTTATTIRHNTLTSLVGMMFLFLAVTSLSLSLSLTEAFTISSIPTHRSTQHTSTHAHTLMTTSSRQPSLALNVASSIDPYSRTLSLEHEQEQEHELLEQKYQFPLPLSTNPYIILGIRHTPSTTISELKCAYRRAVLLYHPDTRDRFWEYGNGNGEEEESVKNVKSVKSVDTGDGSVGGNDDNDNEAYSDFRRINAAYETIYRTLFVFAPCTTLVSSQLS